MLNISDEASENKN